MAKKKIIKKGRISVVKKRWFTVQAPKVFNNVPIGETPAVDPDKLQGRSVRANLSVLLRSARRGNVDITLRIKEVKGSEAVTEFEAMEIVPPFVKRLVKRAKSRIDDSFVVETKDEVKIRVKPLILIRGKVQRSVLTDLRAKTKELITEKAKELTLNELVSKVLMGDIMKSMKGELKNIYKVQSVEMRAMVRQRK